MTAHHLRVPEAARNQVSNFVHTAIIVTDYEPLLLLADEPAGIMPCAATVDLFPNSDCGAQDSAIKGAI